MGESVTGLRNPKNVKGKSFIVMIIRIFFKSSSLNLLVMNAREQGVSQIALEATDMGRPLYEKYGFVKMEDEMELI